MNKNVNFNHIENNQNHFVTYGILSNTNRVASDERARQTYPKTKIQIDELTKNQRKGKFSFISFVPFGNFVFIFQKFLFHFKFRLNFYGRARLSYV